MPKSPREKQLTEEIQKKDAIISVLRNKLSDAEDRYIKSEIELKYAIENYNASECVLRNLRAQMDQEERPNEKEKPSVAASVHDSWARLHSAFNNFERSGPPAKQYEDILATFLKTQNDGKEQTVLEEPEWMKILALVQIANEITSIRRAMEARRNPAPDVVAENNNTWQGDTLSP